jgi:hypothetical protein
MYQQAQARNDMTETDVREAIVRPFLHWLGYAFGTQAHIRTEFPLRYDKAFLGRKKPDSDPVLRGRADYICEVVSYARWVVEVKAAREDLILADSEQAHTYATHPEISALYYMVTNGHKFQLFRVGQPQSPLLEWLQSEIEQRAVEIKNILSPQALQKRVERETILAGKPLAEGLGNKASLSGVVTYVDHKSSNALVSKSLEKIKGMRATVSNGNVLRTTEGLMRAEFEMISAFSAMDVFNQSLGIKGYTFDCQDEYISLDPDNPSIFQNILSMKLDQGTNIPALLGNPSMNLPFDWLIVSFTQAVGYVENSIFKGTFFVDYRFSVPEHVQLPQRLNLIYRSLDMSAVGDFNLNLR